MLRTEQVAHNYRTSDDLVHLHKNPSFNYEELMISRVVNYNKKPKKRICYTYTSYDVIKFG